MSLENSFKGKVVLVTGAGKGIGRSLAEQLCQYEATVYALSRTESTLTSLKEEFPSINIICVDLTNWTETREALEKIGEIDCVINNAGIGGMQNFMDITPEVFDEVMNVNMKAVINVSQVCAQKMIDSGKGGSIVNITAIAGRRPLANYAVYCASKAGVEMLTKTMAVELGKHRIRVNSVCLGCVWTPAFENFVEQFGGKDHLDLILANVKSRTLLPDSPILPMSEVVNTILFTLSDLATMMTGSNITIDGGFCAS